MADTFDEETLDDLTVIREILAKVDEEDDLKFLMEDEPDDLDEQARKILSASGEIADSGILSNSDGFPYRVIFDHNNSEEEGNLPHNGKTTKFGLETIVEEVRREQYEEKILEVYKRLGITYTPSTSGSSETTTDRSHPGRDTGRNDPLIVQLSSTADTASVVKHQPHYSSSSNESGRSTISEWPSRKMNLGDQIIYNCSISSPVGKDDNEKLTAKNALSILSDTPPADVAALLKSVLPPDKQCKEQLITQYLFQKLRNPSPTSESSSSVEGQLRPNEKFSVELTRTKGATILFSRDSAYSDVPPSKSSLIWRKSKAKHEEPVILPYQILAREGKRRKNCSAKSAMRPKSESKFPQAPRYSSRPFGRSSTTFRARFTSSDVQVPMLRLVTVERLGRAFTSRRCLFTVFGFVLSMVTFVLLTYEPPRPMDQIFNNMPFVGRRRSALQQFLDSIYSFLLGLFKCS